MTPRLSILLLCVSAATAADLPPPFPGMPKPTATNLGRAAMTFSKAAPTTLAAAAAPAPVQTRTMQCEVVNQNTNLSALVHVAGIAESNKSTGPFIEVTNVVVQYPTGWVKDKIERIYTNQFGIYPVWSYRRTNEVITVTWTTTNDPVFVRSFVR